MLSHAWKGMVFFSTKIRTRTFNTLFSDQLLIFENITIILYEKNHNFFPPMLPDKSTDIFIITEGGVRVKNNN